MAKQIIVILDVGDGQVKAPQDMTAYEKFIHDNALLLKEVVKATRQRVDTEKVEQGLKDLLQEKMEDDLINSVRVDGATVRLVEGSNYSRVDTKYLKMQYPKIYAECARASYRESHIQVTIKGHTHGGNGI